MLIRALSFILVFMGGFAYGSLHGYVDNIDQCTSFKGWTGYRAMSDYGERRCFWLETKFPYRIKHGIEVNKL